MSGQQQTVDSSLSGRIQRCFSPKTPYGSHQCGCENWDFSFSSPTFSWLLLWDVPPPYYLGADKKKELEQSGAPFYMMLGKAGLMKWVSILGSLLLLSEGFFWQRDDLPQEAAESMVQWQEPKQQDLLFVRHQMSSKMDNEIKGKAVLANCLFWMTQNPWSWPQYIKLYP